MTISKTAKLRQKHVKRSGKKHILPRPETTLSYDLPRSIASLISQSDQQFSKSSASRNETSTSESSKDTAETIVAIARVRLLLDLVHRRNKNQHRNQHFFKWLNLLRRAINHLLNLHQQYLGLDKGPSQPEQFAKASKQKPQLQPKAEEIRRKFEQQAELRSQRELHEEWIRETLVPNAYVAFTSLVSDDQFANLGVMLVGALSDVAGITGIPRRMDKSDGKNTPAHTTSDAKHRQLIATSTIVTGPDLGQVTERTYDSPSGRGQMDRDGTSDLGVLVDRSSTAKNPGQDSTVTTKLSMQEVKSHPARSEAVRADISVAHAPRQPNLSNVSEPMPRVPETPGAQVGRDESKQKTKKRRKNATVIDDLFSGFA